MYKQTLYKVIPDHIKPKILKQMNRYKKWKYGYNEDHDMVVISKTGEIGEIYEIQNLKIALPKQHEVHVFESDKWTRTEIPKVLKKIKTVFDWREYPEDFQEKWYDYIDEEFKKREKGFWFVSKGITTYITGTHYMYLQWSKIDVGKPDFRESNRLILKTDVQAFRLWHPVNALIWQQYQPMHVLVYYQNQVLMLRKCLQIR